MTGILLKALGLVPLPSFMVSGPIASAGVDLNQVLDPGDGGCFQLVSFISAILKL